MHQHDCTCNQSHLNRYQYKGYWIEVFLDADDNDCDRILYSASVELPNETGVISSHPQESREEAEFAAEELIDSWN